MTTNKVLDDAVLAVQRDMDATGIAGRLGFDTPEWDDHGYLRVEYKGRYSSHGLHADEEHEPSVTLALIADLAQAVIAEQDWKAWPTCPAHSLGLYPASEQMRRGLNRGLGTRLPTSRCRSPS
ncbi:hypothetical protein ACFPOI_51420 [Nonomuraea angiospora]|uniref:Uncharacterized protein n=1 Tax=Nonomuraea angiospora TaxID=46172 RepID=A0ABR9M1I2_9ACTN|nr:hypothetical protein [Nonomuraea angiospora]MBE1586776.1 hypothetical protein [Nonomuraea angiospora]